MTHANHRPDIEAADALTNHKQLSRDLAKLLNKDSVVLDVGANRGQFAQEILALAPVQTIYSFEPVPKAYSELEQIAIINPQIKPILKAVSTNNGTTTLFVTESDVGSSLLPPLPNQPSKWLTLEKKLNVETIRLDTFIDSISIEDDSRFVSLLKSDAQGADLTVLRSAGTYLSPDKIGAVLVELNFNNFYEGQNSYHEILSLLDSAGYRMAWMYPYRSSDQWLWWADVLFIGKR